jgi:hypothetical protein
MAAMMQASACEGDLLEEQHISSEGLTRLLSEQQRESQF